jgi:hypothetical protein
MQHGPLILFNTLRFPVCHRYEREFETIKLLEGSGTMWT